ncbi:MAG TPA: response regulator [Caldilineaceae bacterium]|nr:response regulator [Caldilineaceae bacterium]
MNTQDASFAEIEQALRTTLAQLYTPGHRPLPGLLALLNDGAAHREEEVRAALIQAIEQLKPDLSVPHNARSWRLYLVLYYRYVQAYTQEETAEKLAITTRHLRREQQEAVQMLARWLCQRHATGGDKLDEVEPTPSPAEDQATAWRLQVQKELAVLQQTTPGAVADLAKTIHGAVKVGQALAARHAIQLRVGEVEDGILVALHGSALRQVVVTALEKLAQTMSGGEIVLSTSADEDQVEIAIAAQPVLAATPPESALIGEILTVAGGSFATWLGDGQITWCFTLPRVKPTTVLVVDDNVDLVHFYRRYVANTRYQIVHVVDGESMLAAAAESRPAVIVLDVMLPDIDGWELLANCHEHPATRLIPVIVCSVVRRAELAAALNAACYLAKPVRRQQFIQALDQVLAQVVTSTLTD